MRSLSVSVALWLGSSQCSRCIHELTWCSEKPSFTLFHFFQKETGCDSELLSVGFYLLETLSSMNLFKIAFFPQAIICFVNVCPGVLHEDKGRIGTALAISCSFAGI